MFYRWKQLEIPEQFVGIQELSISSACHFHSSWKGHIIILGAQQASECTFGKDTSSTRVRQGRHCLKRKQFAIGLGEVKSLACIHQNIREGYTTRSGRSQPHPTSIGTVTA